MKESLESAVQMDDCQDLPEGSDKIPIGLTLQWPLIQMGRSMKGMVQAYRRFFSVSHEDLKGIYTKKARLADRRGDAESCVTLMEKATSLEPADLASVYALGLAYEKNKQLDQALQCFRKVVKTQPDHAKARFRIGFILLRKRELQAAIAALEATKEYSPDSADLYFRLGQAYDRNQEHGMAITCFEKAVDLDPEFLRAYKHMALTFDSLNKHKQALECLKRALELEEAAD